MRAALSQSDGAQNQLVAMEPALPAQLVISSRKGLGQAH